MRNFYLTKWFFIALGTLAILFVCAFKFTPLFIFCEVAVFALFFLTIIDWALVAFPRNAIEVERILPDRFSNGDENQVHIKITSYYKYAVHVSLLEDLPVQFQELEQDITTLLDTNKQDTITYLLRPTKRGEYEFGNLYIFSKSRMGLVQKRHVKNVKQVVACYPSFMQMRKYDFLAINNQLTNYGVKKIRKIEQNTEFAQIKEYGPSDSFKHINWKASARSRTFMVNQYQAERSQNIYSVIDMGRAMKMPFNGLTLLDYAINSSLVMSSIAMKKDDKAGILTFSRVPDKFVKASDKPQNLNFISEQLYALKTNYYESDYGRLYKFINTKVTTRSLFLIYTNFETFNALERQLKYLRAIAKKHVLVVIFFENTEVTQLLTKTAKKVSDLYEQTVAEQLVFEKKNITLELKKYGIYSIISSPEALTVDSINKYLELKSRGTI